MTTLADILLAPGKREALEKRTADWVEKHVASLGGLKGLTLKASLGALQRARPDIVPKAVHRLLPEFFAALEPLFREFKAEYGPDLKGKDFGTYLVQHRERAVQELMIVADARAAATGHRAITSTYRRIRGMLEGELHSMLPALAKMMRPQ